MNKIFLDIDGVLADFVGGALKVHGKEKEVIWKYDIAECIGIPEYEFWDKIEDTPGFWENLEPYPWSQDLYKLCKKYSDQVIFATTPTHDPNCLSGKWKWIEKHFGPMSSQYFMIGNVKHYLASKKSILIDDSDDQIAKWVGNKGKGILFPRSWNRNHSSSSDPYKYVEQVLTNYRSEG